MKQSTKEQIEESIEDLKEVGGFKDPAVKEVVKKLKKALKDKEKSEK